MRSIHLSIIHPFKHILTNVWLKDIEGITVFIETSRKVFAVLEDEKFTQG